MQRDESYRTELHCIFHISLHVQSSQRLQRTIFLLQLNSTITRKFQSVRLQPLSNAHTYTVQNYHHSAQEKMIVFFSVEVKQEWHLKWPHSGKTAVFEKNLHWVTQIFWMVRTRLGFLALSFGYFQHNYFNFVF